MHIIIKYKAASNNQNVGGIVSVVKAKIKNLCNNRQWFFFFKPRFHREKRTNSNKILPSVFMCHTVFSYILLVYKYRDNTFMMK